MSLPPTNTIGKQLPINKLCDLLRVDVAAAGFCEALTFALVSRADVGEKMGLKEPPSNVVHVSNPKTAEFQVCRNALLPGLLKTTQANRKLPLPLKLFEVSDIVLKDSTTHTGCRNERHMSALIYSKTGSGFEIIHGLLDRVMELLEVPRCEVGSADGFYIKKGDSPCFFHVCADIYLWNEKVGEMGVVHPNTLKAFELPNPVAAFELNLEPFL